MTQLDQHFLDQLCRQFGPARRGLFQELFKAGLIDRKRCEELSIRRRVEALTAAGHGRTEAMVFAAEEFCCSYEKVRKIIYAKN